MVKSACIPSACYASSAALVLVAGLGFGFSMDIPPTPQAASNAHPRAAVHASGPSVSPAALKAISRKLQRKPSAKTSSNPSSNPSTKPLAKSAAGGGFPLSRAFAQRPPLQGPVAGLSLPAGSVASGRLQPRIHTSAAYGTPSFISGTGLRPPAAGIGPFKEGADGAAYALAWFLANRGIFRLDDPARELQTAHQTSDRLGSRHVGFRRMHQGIPVWGSELTAHFTPDGNLYAFNAAYAPSAGIRGGNVFRLDAAKAAAIAVGDLSARTPIEDMGESVRSMLKYRGPETNRYVWIHPATREVHRIWHVAIRPNFRDHWYYFVDAGSGAILEKYNATNSDGATVATAADLSGQTRSLNTYQVGANFFMIDATRKTFVAKSSMPNEPKGALWTLDAGGTDFKTVKQVSSKNNAWSDPAAVSAHYNLGRVFEYFLSTFDRLGIDGAGSTMISAVHVTEAGKKMDNAYWNGVAMAYGDGNVSFKSLARSLDVAAHEMTHGIINATVNLEYKFQSGALNESMADVFGAMVDRDDWTLGEEVVIPSVYPSGAMRNMKDPHNGGKSVSDRGWQPAHMDEFLEWKLEDDNGGVHFNSGIPNRACFLIADAIGREKTEKIYYRVLEARYLNSSSQFIDMRLAAIRAATDLHGEASAEVAAVKAGFNGVGIGGSVAEDKPTPRPQDAPAVKGLEFVALVNADPGDNSLYLAKPVIAGEDDLTQISTTQVFTGTGNPIAIPDDGSVLIFINSDNSLCALDDSSEVVVSATGTWKSVAVSPDGSKIAATTVEPDASIHILDLINPEASKTITLYTPTTGADVKARNVVYADALDWNSTGEYLLYDAFNSVDQADGTAIEYWDANLLDVKAEVITPFLPTRPEGINIGNPSFAQTSDVNFVFDLFDEASGKWSVMAADLFTGAIQVIDSNGAGQGIPRYSTQDDILVYQSVEGEAINVRQAPLAKDKITRSGATEAYISNGRNPNWFAIGSRPAGIAFPGLKRKTAFDMDLESGSRVRLELPVAADVDVSVYDLSGRRLARLAHGRMRAGSHGLRLGSRRLARRRCARFRRGLRDVLYPHGGAAGRRRSGFPDPQGDGAGLRCGLRTSSKPGLPGQPGQRLLGLLDSWPRASRTDLARKVGVNGFCTYVKPSIPRSWLRITSCA